MGKDNSTEILLDEFLKNGTFKEKFPGLTVKVSEGNMILTINVY